MARFFITNFVAQGAGEVGVIGIVEDKQLGIGTVISVDHITYDSASSTSARQQVQDNIVAAVNAQLIASQIPLTLIASDIEFIS